MGVSTKGRIRPTGRVRIGVGNHRPVWGTAAGSLGAANGGVAFTFNLLASDPDNQPAALRYRVVAGALPAGLDLQGGTITGTPANVPGTYTFTLRVSDGVASADREFSLEVTNQTPVWTTAGGSLGSVASGSAVSQAVAATDPNGDAITYAVVSGSLPAGLTLGSNGVIAGTAPTVTTDATSTFTVRATDALGAFIDRAFSLTVAAPSDAQFANVSLLLHMDGTNASTTFVDSGPLKFPSRSGAGTAYISTAQAKFGGASGYFSGNGSVTYPASASNFGTANFTVEAWTRASPSQNNFAQIVGQFITGTANGAWSFRVRYGSNMLHFCYYNNGFVDITTGLNPCDDQWHHLAVSRQGTALRLFMDGVLATTHTLPTSFNFGSGQSTVVAYNQHNGVYYNGFLDDLRITKNVARYTAAFTPPALAFPNQ